MNSDLDIEVFLAQQAAQSELAQTFKRHCFDGSAAAMRETFETSIFDLGTEDEDAAEAVEIDTPEAVIRGETIRRWAVYPLSWFERCQLMDEHGDADRRFARIADQMIGLADSGAAVALYVEDVKALPVRVGRALMNSLDEHGQAPAAPGGREVLAPGNAIDSPVKVRIGDLILRFKVERVGQLQYIGYGRTVEQQADSLVDICDHKDEAWEMSPDDGFWLMTEVLPPIVRACRKMAKTIDQIEYYAHLRLDELPVSTAISKLNNYADQRKAEAKFMVALAGAKRGKKGKK